MISRTFSKPITLLSVLPNCSSPTFGCAQDVPKIFNIDKAPLAFNSHLFHNAHELAWIFIVLPINTNDIAVHFLPPLLRTYRLSTINRRMTILTILIKAPVTYRLQCNMKQHLRCFLWSKRLALPEGDRYRITFNRCSRAYPLRFINGLECTAVTVVTKIHS
jgi:hypothetical protein